MTKVVWETIKTQYCHHIDQQVGLQAKTIYPPEYLPDQLSHVLAHRCSHGLACNLDGRPSCIWAGTNPVIDPFVEK